LKRKDNFTFDGIFFGAGTRNSIAHPSVVDDLSKAFEERFNTPYVDE